MDEVDSVYETFWKDLVETDGTMDPEKVKRELFDYHTVLGEVPRVYDAVTNGRISKPNTAAEHVIEAFEDYVSSCAAND